MKLLTSFFSVVQKLQKKEVNDMMRKYLSIIAVVLVMVFTSGLYAHGTGAGSIISNATASGSQSTNTTGLGVLSGACTNSSGAIFSAFITNTTAVTTHVDPGYDLSVPLQITSDTQFASAGSYVDFELYVTNWGNIADNIRLTVTNKGDSFGAAFTYDIYTNTIGAALVSGANVVGTYSGLPVDSELHLWVRVNIPGVAPNNSTNRIQMTIADTVGAAGDAWPGVNAIPPATSDVGNARDSFLTTAWYVVVAGPVIQLSKSVDVSAARPYEDLTYTITFTNAGSATAQNLIIQDVLPNHSLLVVDSAEGNGNFNGAGASGLASVSYFSNGTTWVGSGSDSASSISNLSAVRWTIVSNVDAGDYGTVQFTVRVK